MSNPQTQTQEESYISKLDIGLASPERFKAMVDLYATVPRAVLCGVGISGAGKSQSIKQVAKTRGVPFPDDDDAEDLSRPSQILHIPQMQVEDFYVPTTPLDPTDRQYYDRRIPRRFQAVLDYVEKNRKAIESGRMGRPILLVEEPNRARDRSVTAALFTLLEDRMIGDTRVSSLIQMVCLMNPSGGGNAVNQFEKDSASRRRLLFVGVTPSFGDFVENAERSQFHPAVIDYIKAQPTMMYDHAAAAAGHVFACPASWETVSDLLKAVEKKTLSLTCMNSRLGVAGKIGMTATTAFFDYIENKATVIDPREILMGYHENSNIRARVLNYIQPKNPDDRPRHDLIAGLCRNIAETLFRERKDPSIYKNTLPLFMDDLMPDMLVAFITTHIPAVIKDGAPDGNNYRAWMGTVFASVPAYNSAMQKLNEAQARARAEADKDDGTP